MIQNPERYTMTAGQAAKALNLSRQGFHDLVADRKELSYFERPRGRQKWKYFDPTEVEALAQKREGLEA